MLPSHTVASARQCATAPRSRRPVLAAPGTMLRRSSTFGWSMIWSVLLARLCSIAMTAEIRGRVGQSVDGLNMLVNTRNTETEILVTSVSGEQLRTFADKEGWFTLRDVTPGAYVLTSLNPMVVYPEVYLDVTANKGLTRASYLINTKQQLMNNPLIIPPVGQAEYYEERKPLDLWSFIKSPYGLMMGFMLFGIFVFPMLKVDPEEYKEAMAQLRGGQGGQQQQQQRIRDR